MNDEDSPTFVGYTFGTRIDSGRPRGQLGTVVDTSLASEARVRRAREFFAEIPLSDLEPLSPRLWRHVASGTEYRIVESQVLEARMPTHTGVTAFTLVGDRLIFLKIRGHEHLTERIEHGGVYGYKVNTEP